jgi:hypothetical protein
VTGPSRRAVLTSLGAVAVLGTGGQTVRCFSATIESTDHRIANEFPYREYVVAEVTVRSPAAPRLDLRVERPDGVEHRTKKLNPGTNSYEFGPFGHHTVGDYTVSLDGCFERASGEVDM